MKIINRLQFLLLVTLFFAQAFIGASFIKPKIKISKQDSSINFNESFSRLATFGHGRFIGAITWVLTLLEGDIEHYKSKDGNSWMFHRFNSITIYDPLFYENYRFGGQYLSIIKDDISGATFIYDKGLKLYPDDFELNYHAGFHYYFEANHISKAISSYEKLSQNKEILSRFPLLPSILAKLRVENGDLNSAFSGLKDVYDSLADDSKFKLRFFNTLYTLKAKRDLKCLNGPNPVNCERNDFSGEPYQKKKGSYLTSKSLSKIMLKKKN